MSGMGVRGVGVRSLPRNALHTSGATAPSFHVWIPEPLLRRAHEEGLRRYRKRRGSEPRSNRPPEYLWHNHMEGAAAEAGYARFRGVVWIPTPGPDGESGDVCGDHVKGTSAVPGHLIVRPEEHPERFPTKRYVLLVGELNHWQVVGWLLGAEIRNPLRWREPGDGKLPHGCRNKSWWHPARELRSPALLRP